MLYNTEEEQMNALKHLFKKYSIPVVAIIILMFGSIYGYNAWKHHQQKQSVIASSLYAQLATTIAIQSPDMPISKSDKKLFFKNLSSLQKNHSKSIYSYLGALLAAKNIYG